MPTKTSEESALIPPTDVVRIELARNAREGRRLRSLLRLSRQAAEDRRFIESLTGRPHEPRHEPAGRGVGP